jgi:radical SAM-linked protein
MKKQRYRILFSKTAHMQYTSHLDLILTWERVFRRAGLPLAYSEGFSPRPVLNLAAPLPLGYLSTGEIGDFWLSERISHPQFTNLLTEALPPGILINEIYEIGDINAPKLPTLVRSASYMVDLKTSDPDLEKKIKDLRKQKSLPRTRKKKEYDLRPLIIKITQDQNPGGDQEILMTLAALPGATGRPDEVLFALNIPTESTRISRTEIILRQSEGD